MEKVAWELFHVLERLATAVEALQVDLHVIADRIERNRHNPINVHVDGTVDTGR